MNKTLYDLYHGNINPVVKTFDRKSEYGQLMLTIADTEEQLLKALHGEEKAIFQRFGSAYLDLNCKTAEERFIEGFRLGAKIAIEVYQKDDGALFDIVE